MSTQPEAAVAKNIVDLQTSTAPSQVPYKDAKGKEGKAELTSLNTHVNAWFLLKLTKPGAKGESSYHLENAFPKDQKVSLDPKTPTGIVLAKGGSSVFCELWPVTGESPLDSAKTKSQPYAPLCDGKVYLRNKIEGYRTTKEWVVEFLRDNVWGGESITSFVKETFYKDNFLISSSQAQAAKHDPHFSAPDMPPLAQIEPKFNTTFLEPVELGFEILNSEPDKKMAVGKWYQMKGRKGIYVSMISPEYISPEIFKKHTDVVNELDNVEKHAISYLAAFDLKQFDLHFALGTEHPRVDWSERTRAEMRNNKIPGPDGIASTDPLVSTGLVNPELAKKIAASFTGGFKRSHGAFKWGPLGSTNAGSHYGFIENGVVYSSLQEDLATIVITDHGKVIMKTWKPADNRLIPHIRYARQNGVAIIDQDDATGQSFPGKLVGHWTNGNWSGSQDMKFRTLRAGMCLASGSSGDFLIYGYFSTSTPSAMARIFESYGCKYAMHLDMNALEHTYLAAYIEKNGAYYPHHLITGMKVLDERFKGNVPRFIGYPDNRDFFYFTVKDQGAKK
jgi:hypothetical protein